MAATTTPSGPTGQSFYEPRGQREEWLARWAGTGRGRSYPARWAGLGERLAPWAARRLLPLRPVPQPTPAGSKRVAGGRAALQPPGYLLKPRLGRKFQAGRGERRAMSMDVFRPMSNSDRASISNILGLGSRGEADQGGIAIMPDLPQRALSRSIARSSPTGPTNLKVRRHRHCSNPPSPRWLWFNMCRLAPNSPLPARPPRRGSRG